MRERVEDARFLRPERAIVRWSHRADLVESPQGVPGFQVERGHFDLLLLTAAKEAGVRVIQPALARRPQRTAAGEWRVPVHAGGTVRVIKALFLVDATGRSGVIHRSRTRYGAQTTAIYAYWRNTGLQGPETAWMPRRMAGIGVHRCRTAPSMPPYLLTPGNVVWYAGWVSKPRTEHSWPIQHF